MSTSTGLDLPKVARWMALNGRGRRYLRRHRSLLRATSALARVEVLRAVAPGAGKAIGLARRQLARCHQLDLDRELLDRAATLSPGVPIHLATALTLPGLRAVVTYDTRMTAAALALGLPAEAPA